MNVSLSPFPAIVAQSKSANSVWRGNLIVAAHLIAAIVFFDLLLWFSARGGTLSVVTALSSARRQAPVIDLDVYGLALPFTLIASLAALGICGQLGIDARSLRRRTQQALVIGLFLGSGLLGRSFGEAMVAQYLAGHGYTHCRSGDFRAKSGRNHVWFAHYVLVGGRCV